MVRQCARFVFFDAFLIFLITQAEEELKYKLAGGHDCRNYKGTEENSVFGREGLCDIRDIVDDIEYDRGEFSADGSTKGDIQGVNPVDKPCLQFSGQPEAVFNDVGNQEICKSVMCALKDGACNKYKEENAEVHRFCGSGGADGTADKEKCRVENDAQHEPRI